MSLLPLLLSLLCLVSFHAPDAPQGDCCSEASLHEVERPQWGDIGMHDVMAAMSCGVASSLAHGRTPSGQAYAMTAALSRGRCRMLCNALATDSGARPSSGHLILYRLQCLRL